MKRRPHGSERRTGHCLSCEEVEKKRLQKLKLLGKDKIMEILERHRQAGAIQ